MSMLGAEASARLKLAILAGLLAVIGYLGAKESGWISQTSETAHQQSQQSQSAPQQPSISLTPDEFMRERQSVLPSEIEVLDSHMWRSAAQIISSPSGDLRPVYRVVGRIRNNSSVELKEVDLRISILDRSKTEVDGADISLRIPIPPGATRAFDQQIQVLAPPKFTWTYEVISVVPRQ